MNLKRSVAIFIFALGVGALAISYYIKNEVKQGEKKIAHAEKQVKKGDALLSLSPATKQLGKGFLGSAQEKIAQGKEDVAKYTSLAGWLQMGGILFILLGLGGLFIPQKRS